MAYKILTKNGIENTNIDGARENFFNTGMRDGVVQGVLNEGKFESNSSNSIYMDSCELRIAGHRIVIDEPVYKTFSNTPNNDIRYSMVAQIVVTENGDVAFSLFVQSVETVLIKDNLYATITGQGTYQVEIGRFTLTANGTIEDVVKTIDTITGATESIAGGINIGNVTTEKIDYKFDAEVDVSQRYDSEQKKTFTDFNFQLPLDVTDIELKANNAEQVANEAKTSANAAVGTANTALDTANTAESNSSNALTNSQNAVNIANTANTKSDNAVNTANEALSQVVTGLGTKVYDVSGNSLSNAKFTGHNGINVDMNETNTDTFDIRLDETITTEIANAQSTADSAVSKNSEQDTAIDNITNNTTKITNPNGGFAGGTGANTTNGGGSIGNGANSTAGGAVGYNAITGAGGAVGGYASTDEYPGGAVGGYANATYGGAVGAYAKTTKGGAVGERSKSGYGFAGGFYAQTVDSSNNAINAIQLGTGTNSKEKTFQVYDDNIYDSNTHTLTVQNMLLNGVSPATTENLTVTNALNLNSSSVAYIKLSGFGEFIYGDSYTLLLETRGSETIVVKLSSDGSTWYAFAERIFDSYSKIKNLYYSLSEKALFVKVASYCTFVNATVISNTNSIGTCNSEVSYSDSFVPSDAVEIFIGEPIYHYTQTVSGVTWHISEYRSLSSTHKLVEMWANYSRQGSNGEVTINLPMDMENDYYNIQGTITDGGSPYKNWERVNSWGVTRYRTYFTLGVFDDYNGRAKSWCFMIKGVVSK